VNLFEIVVVIVCAGLGVRSLLYWLRRPFEGRDVTDHLLFGLFVTGRVGVWFALAGLFSLYAVTDTQGRAFIDDVRQFDWFFVVLVALAAVQLVASFLLGRRSDAG
jgi:hypothetical protein